MIVALRQRHPDQVVLKSPLMAALNGLRAPRSCTQKIMANLVIDALNTKYSTTYKKIGYKADAEIKNRISKTLEVTTLITVGIVSFLDTVRWTRQKHRRRAREVLLHGR